MANQRISQFTYTSTITGDELIGVAINGQNKSISVGQILAAADESCKNVQQDKRSRFERLFLGFESYHFVPLLRFHHEFPQFKFLWFRLARPLLRFTSQRCCFFTGLISLNNPQKYSKIKACCANNMLFLLYNI